MDAQRSGRQVLVLFAADLLALGTCWVARRSPRPSAGGSAAARSTGGSGATPGGGGTSPVETLPNGGGGSPSDTAPTVMIPTVTAPPGTGVIIPDADIAVNKTGPASVTPGG